nr:MAG TPA: hypothetical protein [Bacteriophage sp.]
MELSLFLLSFFSYLFRSFFHNQKNSKLKNSSE